MHSLLVAAAFFIGGAYSTAAANADVITIGHATFDFDAPSSPLTAGQEAFFRQYKDAVNRHDEAALMSLQDGSMNSCRSLPATRPCKIWIRRYLMTSRSGSSMQPRILHRKWVSAIWRIYQLNRPLFLASLVAPNRNVR